MYTYVCEDGTYEREHITVKTRLQNMTLDAWLTSSYLTTINPPEGHTHISLQYHTKSINRDFRKTICCGPLHPGFTTSLLICTKNYRKQFSSARLKYCFCYHIDEIKIALVICRKDHYINNLIKI